MVVPAVIFLAISPGSNLWASAMPTDLAIALAGLALLGKKIHPRVRTFLLLLAVADDFFSLFIFAILYGNKLHLADSLTTLGAALAGFLLGRMRKINPDKLVKLLNPVINFFVIPLYVVLQIQLGFSTAISNTITVGFLAARIFGKALGIGIFVWYARNRKWISSEIGITVNEGIGVGLLAGAAMTVSLVIGGIAAQSQSELEQLRSGVFLSAIVSVVLGCAWLRFRARIKSL
jgi:NhaA family Na+:H+ antiporter